MDVSEDETQHSTLDGESAPFSPAASTTASSRSRTPSSRASKRTKKADVVLDIVAQKLQTPMEKPKEFDNFGRHIAEQLRNVSKDQAIILTKIINDAIFEAQCGTLTKNSHIASKAADTEHRYVGPPAPVQTMQQRIRTPAEPVLHNFQPTTVYAQSGYDYQSQRSVCTSLADYFSNTTP